MVMNDQETEMKPWLNNFWQEWLKPLIMIAAVLAPFRSAIADWNDVPTGSMKPTIMEGDRVVVNKLSYDLKVPFTTIHLKTWDDPGRGDIVVFFSPADEKRLVKRVIGLPGDRISMRENALFVNGKPAEYGPLLVSLEEQAEIGRETTPVFALETIGSVSHAVMEIPDTSAVRSFMPVIVPPGRYFMMGDNRDQSFDSRWFGFVDRKRIVGRAVAVAFSLDRAHLYKPRFDRMFKSLG